MTCEELTDRMPDVAAGRDAWTPDDAAHLRSCDDCDRAWRIVVAASRAGRELTVDTARLATSVVARLAEPVAAPQVRWSRVLLGLAAAAGIAVAVYVGARGPMPVPTARAVEVLVEPRLFPELAPLTEPQLQVLLASVAVDDTADLGGAELPRLGSLTDEQLEQLLISVESE